MSLGTQLKALEVEFSYVKKISFPTCQGWEGYKIAAEVSASPMPAKGSSSSPLYLEYSSHKLD